MPTGEKRRVELVVHETTSKTLTAIGEIYEVNTADPSKSELDVSDIKARLGWPSRFVTTPGTYQYRFHVEKGTGKFRVGVREIGTTKWLGNDEFDTAFGFSGKVLSFTV
ncbi:hypothetical protein D7X96_03345 [Corallococcus interemptor]|uniref:Uncharacterized protein n=1 Tax=Corallococcus interemptor TaxID=2316720 RepID=A0A3A8R1K7_9BACT|nr:hypothetical protein [Corallococcus interemptor]RKH73100.1 hypothetical protein D7X96_03345 [Corallococcus interemptor]